MLDICSMWQWLSMPPGSTSRPAASMSRLPAGSFSCRATMRPSITPISQRNVSAAVTTVPLRMVRSNTGIRACYCIHRNQVHGPGSGLSNCIILLPDAVGHWSKAAARMHLTVIHLIGPDPDRCQIQSSAIPVRLAWALLRKVDMSMRWWLLALAAVISTGAAAEKKYGPGVSDTEIKLGQTVPYSGPVSAYGTIGRSEAAYFEMLNQQGGVNGRKIRLLSVDDGYSPPKTVEQTRKLVEQEEVLAIFSPLGTPTNSATQKYLNAKKVPQ